MLRKEIEAPRLKKSRTANVDPMRLPPKIATELARRKTRLKDMEAPMCTQPKTDKVSPKRLKLRSDNVAPKGILSNTAIDEPKRGKPLIEIAVGNRNKLRIARDVPIVRKSSNDARNSVRAIEGADIDVPNCIELCKNNAGPTETESKVDMNNPRRPVPESIAVMSM